MTTDDFEPRERTGERDPMPNDQLDPISPAEAVELYLTDRDPEVSAKTLQNQRYRLSNFLQWCEEEAGLEDLTRLTERDLHRYRKWRGEQVKPVTLNGELQTLRVFLEFAADIDAVEPGMRERVRMPSVDPADEASDELLAADRQEAILDHLEKFAYASRDHVIMTILCHTGIRLGGLQAFDLTDFDRDEPCLELRHRPDTGTPLKNTHGAERTIAVGEYYAKVIDDYIEHNREDTVDDHGRAPLITSREGRYSETSIRNTVYQATRPCEIGECPHDRDPATCEAMDYDTASKCPSSRSPHGVRRGTITRTLRDGTPEEVVTERMNVSSEVLDQHYDERTEREKMRLRREFLEDDR